MYTLLQCMMIKKKFRTINAYRDKYIIRKHEEIFLQIFVQRLVLIMFWHTLIGFSVNNSNFMLISVNWIYFKIHMKIVIIWFKCF